MKQKNLLGFAAAVVVAVVLFVVAGCVGEPRWSLANTPFGDGLSTAVTPSKSKEHRHGAERGVRGIRVAMSATVVSESGLPVYDRIVDYLAKTLGSDCELVSGFSDSAINAMLEAGTVDVGFVCGLPYVLGRDKENPTVELLVTPIMKSARYKNVPKFYSYVSVIGYQLVL